MWLGFGLASSRRSWAPVVVDEPGVALGLELVTAGEEASVERRPPAILVEDGLLEPFDDGVVVG
jgi:hypothetical protein